MSITVSNVAVTGYLSGTYGWTLERAARVASIATVYGSKAEPCEGGFVRVTWQAGTSSYEIEEHAGRTP